MKKENKKKCTYKLEYPIYAKVKEAKTGKDLVINTRRILYVKDIDKNTCLVMMNSGYKLKVRKELNKFFTQNLCVPKPISEPKPREPQKIIIVKDKK